ncbi:Prephenate dehydratase-domain-containing protein [Russula compacta]|nr:Prephenate dehydratase-domain-containing protein [Russula compacta]
MSSNLTTQQVPSGTGPKTGDDSKEVLAYLGPAGTYSHQAACDRFAKTVHYYPRDTISADVFHSVGPSVHLGLLPQENSIFGIVTETYDLLRSTDVGESKWIRGAVTLSIQHCLVVRRGKTVRDIKRVLSHEQALGQCRRFILEHLPEVQLVSVASTAAAAEEISTQADSAADSAAICSKICLQLFANLEILYEGIQDEHHNFTRFYILANHPSSPLPNTRYDGLEECNALVRLEVLQRADLDSHVAPPTISELLAALRLRAMRIDRRPSTSISRQRFGSVYFVEVIDSERSDDFRPSHDASKVGIAGLSPWKETVLGAVARVVESGGRANLLGTW